jgi:lipopolysaccharide export LptBFGC system permease protein LptF
MKSSIVVMALSAALFGVVVTGCNTPAENVKNAQSNVVDANADLDKANKEYLADIEKTRIETSEKIAANNKTMTEFDLRIANEKADAKAEYKAKMTELDKRNTDLKMRMDNYKASSKENWDVFKTEFNHDMDELGKAFKDLTVKNTK